MKKNIQFAKIRLFITAILLFPAVLSRAQVKQSERGIADRVPLILKQHILKEAAWALTQQPETVTPAFSSRSAGGKHDFFSEGDYWWPDSANPDSPYVQRDGLTNPDNFVAHRKAMIRFSRVVGALASAYILTGDKKYATHAMLHCHAWFIDTATLMNPNLLFAQAIKGRATGRGIGIIDTIHFMEVVQGLIVFEKARAANTADIERCKQWFEAYLNWLTMHSYGKAEMNAANNHGTCWVMQVAAFSKFTGNLKMLEFCSERYKSVLLPGQMGVDGSFPQELRRTKPYGYSIFNLDAMAMICQILSTGADDLWAYETAAGRSVKKGISYLVPYIKTKKDWPLKPDVMYWEEWPVAQPFLVFGAVRFNNEEWFNVWKKLDHSPQNEEVIRNLPVRNPLIWLNH
ncbi:alginate lyase family protein [Flavitalea sp.]|nr:alginate lyase family protein [Flavitalea sp.]